LWEKGGILTAAAARLGSTQVPVKDLFTQWFNDLQNNFTEKIDQINEKIENEE